MVVPSAVRLRRAATGSDRRTEPRSANREPARFPPRSGSRLETGHSMVISVFVHDSQTSKRFLTPRDVAALAVVADVSVPTARRFLFGLDIWSSCRARLERAAAKFGIVPSPGEPGPFVALHDREPEADL